MKFRPFLFFLIFTMLISILPGCDANQSKNGKVLEEFESAIHFFSYTPAGILSAEFDGSVDATLYENLTGEMDYVGYLETVLAFDTESCRFQTVLPDSKQGCYYIADHRVCSLTMYDNDLGFWTYHEMALDMDGGRMAILFENHDDGTPLYLLIGSADPNVDPAELVEYFEDFIVHRWPQWWDTYQSGKIQFDQPSPVPAASAAGTFLCTFFREKCSFLALQTEKKVL